jgi:hypothetical protein
MATVYIQSYKDTEGKAREGEPLPRPYVILKDGTVMKYLDWLAQGNPS